MSLTERAPVSSSISNTMRRSVTLSGAAYVMPRWRHSSTSYFGGSNSYFTNSSWDELEKSEIGNTDFEYGLKTFVRSAAHRLLHQQELVVRCLLNLDEVRHLRHFLNCPEK